MSAGTGSARPEARGEVHRRGSGRGSRRGSGRGSRRDHRGADHAAITAVLAAHPGLAGQVRETRPALTVWAAAHGQPGSVELLAGLGFNVNAMGRSDAPADDPWQTALHVAALEGHLELARILLDLGADPGIRDQRFDSTPLGWARYFGQEQLIKLLAPLTAPEESAAGPATDDAA